MAPGSRTSYPGEIDLHHDSNIQPRGPTKTKDSVNCYPWDSRGRRLFPQRRTSLPTSVSRNLNETPCFSPCETSPSDDHSPIDHEGLDRKSSNPSSVDSVATVIVRLTPNNDRPSPKTDSGFEGDAHVLTPYLAGSLPVSCSVEPPVTPHKSSKKRLRTSFSAPLYNDVPARESLQWKSMAHFQKSSHRLSPRILSRLPNGEQAFRHSDKSCDPSGVVSKVSLPIENGPCQWSQSPKTTAQPRLSPTEVGQDSGREGDTSKDHSRRDVPALKISIWDCTTRLSTVATVAGNGNLHVHHLALLSVIMPMEALYPDKVSLSFMVFNALRTDQKRNLGLGQSSLLFKENVSQAGFFPREGVELVIVRDRSDLEKPLNLHFAFTYLSPWHFVMASLPTFRPKEGRSLSEVVFIAEPRPPLSMTTYIRDPVSSWRLHDHAVSQVTCYERTDLPRLHSAGFGDDILMRILELEPVRFRALGESILSRVIWNLDITVHELPGEQVDCRMSFFVEVGMATALVSLIPHGWVPRYFIVDGRVMTEKAGECWKDKEGQITIFKQRHIGYGPIMVETYWQEPPKYNGQNVYNTDSLPLPRVAHRKVLGGRLTCRANKMTFLSHPGDDIRPYNPVDGPNTVLPTMDAGYRILLKGVTKARARKSRRDVAFGYPVPPIPGVTQLSEHAVESPVAKVKKSRGTSLSHTVRRVNGVASPRKHLLQSLLLPILVLFLLVPCFLLFVQHVRKENSYNEGKVWRDEDPPSRDGEIAQAMFTMVGSDPLQSAVAAVDGLVEVAKCEGWRDWVDYGSGWKGCMP